MIIFFVNWVFCFKIARNGNFLALSFSKMASVSLIKSLIRMYLLMSVVINVPCISVKQLRNNGLFCLVIIICLWEMSQFYMNLFLSSILKYQTWLRFCSLTDMYLFFQNDILKTVARVQGIGAWPLLVQI